MKSVLVIVPSLEWVCAGGAKSGGGSVVALNFLNELSKRKDVELSVLQSSFSSVKNFENASVFEVDSSTYFVFRNNIQDFVKTHKFDLVLCLTMDFMGVNYFLQSHSFEHRCKNLIFPMSVIKKIFNRKKIQYQKDMFKGFENCIFIATSNIIKKDYCKNLKINPENIFVVPPGAVQKEFEKSALTQNSVINFGLVAGSSMNKGGFYTLIAFAVLNLFYKNFKLTIVEKQKSGKSLLHNIAKFFHLDSKIDIFPYGEPLDVFYKKSDYLLLPSKNEAFGLVVTEAMGFGVPPIVSSTAGAADIINKQNGFLFNRSNIFSFVNTLYRAIKIYNQNFELYKKISSNAFDTVEFYSWKSYCDRVLSGFNF